MYCKHCGKEIADDSIFCQHCGKQISERKENITNGSSIIVNWLLSISKKYLLLYAIWFALNVLLLCFGKKLIYMGSSRYVSPQYCFFPFTSNERTHFFDPQFYDVTEFVVYVVLIPLLVCYYFKYWHKTKKK